MSQNVNPRYGATVEEWNHFGHVLGLFKDLLPVVSNPKARISEKSKMKALGKTPSRYNGDRLAVGIPDWTSKVATEREVQRWQHEEDFGICLQTRNVRAIDLDLTDAALAQRVLDTIELTVGVLPKRMRANSPKCLLLFQMEGDFGKRVIRTEGGIIEWLANGQQCIVAGTHPTGVRYEWEGGLPLELPWLTTKDFEVLWSVLVEAYSTAPALVRPLGAKPTMPRESSDLEDDLLSFLERKGWVKEYDSQGRAHITCPWEDEHTSESVDSATTYFPAGVGGFEQGHFRCLHAHCEHRTDGDFVHAIGYVQDDFQVVAPEPGDTTPVLLAPAFERDKNGAILATLNNLLSALRRADICGWHLAHDDFSDTPMKARYGTRDWVPFCDNDYTAIRSALETGPKTRKGKDGADQAKIVEAFKPLSSQMVREACNLVSSENRFDAAQEWLNRVVPKWDGVPRCASFWSRAFSAPDNAYIRACGLYFWSALAGRVLVPGIQVDMVVILIGLQGLRKSTALKALMPSEDQFMYMSFTESEDTLARRMRGKLLAEIAELKGMEGRGSEHTKAFVTQSSEQWVPKYKEFATTYKRRLVMVGTANRPDVLFDETGNRRWLPMMCQNHVDIEYCEANALQLWAEAKVLFESNGIMYQEAEQLAKAVHKDHMISDLWEGRVIQWLDETTFSADGETTKVRNGDTLFPLASMLCSALGLEARQLSRKEELRGAALLRRLGYDSTRVRTHGAHQTTVWGRPELIAQGQRAVSHVFEDDGGELC